jgi:hypothetical protein
MTKSGAGMVAGEIPRTGPADPPHETPAPESLNAPLHLRLRERIDTLIDEREFWREQSEEYRKRAEKFRRQAIRARGKLEKSS